MRIWGNHRITTFQIIALGFVLMILIGTLLLMLPFSSRQQTGTCFSDCLFTATSAVCVTGLVVQDTATHWSSFGQAVILFLIQIGGMGVVTAALTLSFLSASRMNEGKLNLNMTTELMDDMISEAVNHLSRQLKNHTLCRNKAEELLFVKADARLIIQMIINLLDNAVKYAPEGSTIRIDTAERDGKVAVRIADEGPGIPDDQKELIFDLFYSSGNPTGDSRRGLGIGLALCQSIIKAHGGTIAVSDNEPHGAVFEFMLPRDEVNLNE